MKNKIKRIIEELLQENELDITYISAVATVITETRNEPSKRGKNRRKIF